MNLTLQVLPEKHRLWINLTTDTANDQVGAD